MGTTIESSWENTRLQDQNAMLRNALVDCERAGELLAYAGHKEAAQKIFDVVSDALERSLGNPDTEQVGWIYTYPDMTKNMPPVLSRHRLDNKSEWIERPIYVVETPNAPHEGADAALSRTLPLDAVVWPRR